MALASEAQRFAAMYCCSPSYTLSVVRVFSSFRNSVRGRAISRRSLSRLQKLDLGNLASEVGEDLLGQRGVRGLAALDPGQVAGVGADGVGDCLERFAATKAGGLERGIHAAAGPLSLAADFFLIAAKTSGRIA